MDEEFSLPQPFTGGSTALALPAPSVGSGLESMSSMSPMESMMEIFMEIRDGILTLVDLFQMQILGGADEARDLELAAADTDVTDPGPPAEEPAEGGSPTERKIFNKANLKKALLLGGIALLFTFTEQIEKALAPILKFIKENVFPSALNLFYGTIESFANLFTDLKDRFGVLFSEDATWWERITAFLGIFKDIGAFFLGIFDTLTESIANLFGLSFDPYDGLGSYIIGETKAVLTNILNFFTDAYTRFTEFINGFDLFGDIKQSVTDIFDGIMGLFAGDFSVENFKKIFGSLFDIATAGINLAINAVLGIFGFETDEPFKLSEFISGIFTSVKTFFTDAFAFLTPDPDFSVTDFIKDKASEIFEKIKGFFSFDLPTIEFPELPDIGTIVQSFAAGLLPDPESYAGKTLYYFKPELLDLKKSFASPDIDVSGEGGDLDLNGGSSSTQISTTFTNNTTKELTELGGAGNPTGNTVIVNDMSNNSSTNATADTYNNMDLSPDHSDPVSKIADNVAVAPMFR